MAILRRDPESATKEDLRDLKRELAELAARVDALAEAVRALARDHYKPVPEGKLNDALARADRKLTTRF